MLAHLNKENAVLEAPYGGKASLKTPGPGKMNSKTPFKIPLNDENGVGTLHPKTGKKNLFSGHDASQFVTPVGPRRPALAGKTTNVKTRNLVPPGEQTGKKGALGSAVRPARTRVSLSEQTKPVVNPEDEVPEIEYMPPAPKDIPWIPDDLEEFDIEDLKKTYMKGCHRTYLADLDEDGKSAVTRHTEELYRKGRAELDAETSELMDEIKGLAPKRSLKPKTSALGSGPINVPKTRIGTSSRTVKGTKETKRPTTSAGTVRPTSRPASRGASTLDSRRAASALAKRPSSRPASSASTRTVDSKAVPRGHSRSASTSTIPPNKKTLFGRGGPKEPSIPPHSRSKNISISAHQAASKNSIGYTNGRQVGKKVVKELRPKPQKETALEAIERILAQDEATLGPIDAPLDMIVYDDPLEEDDIVLDIPEPLMDDEFFMSIPE
ncbi:hypothetical protein EDC01DRAFT_629802 [Geopyxis carbonaria]|nr:hypothetical protein EDC01DRAFT_629802 [Geopyxis carbonaria]